jgi:predicted heme/steroid binding protein
MRVFKKEELSKYDGKNNIPAYIAVHGKVYDVTKSFLWRNGNHQVLHEAGRDLTKQLEDAPHGADLLDRVPIIGVLRE